MPPASLTTCDFSARALPPRSQTTMWPATFAGSRVPGRQSCGSAAPAAAASTAAIEGPVTFCPNGTLTEAPACANPSNCTVPSQVGMVEAATVVYQGDA